MCLPLSATLPNFTVQISHHSSFERDQYIRYQSSLSTQGALSSLAPTPHQDSGLSESSSSSILISEETDQNDIVPDSQSLPGSSSYVPSKTVSEVTSSYELAGPTTIVHSSRIADSSDFNFSSLREPEPTQTGDALSSSIVSASEGLTVSSQRSRSAPLQPSSAASRNPSSRRVAIVQLSSSVSNPSLVIPDSLEQVSLTQLVPTPTQGDNSSFRTKNISTQTQCSFPSQKLKSTSPELDFQTQVSFVLDSQTTQASTELVGKYIYHSAQ